MMRTLNMIVFAFLFSQLVYADKMVILQGKITDTNTSSGIEGIHIQIRELNRGSYTNQDGIYRFENVPVGQYAMEAWGSGYCTLVVQNVQIQKADTVQLDLEMQLCEHMNRTFKIDYRNYKSRSKTTLKHTTEDAEKFMMKTESDDTKSGKKGESVFDETIDFTDFDLDDEPPRPAEDGASEEALTVAPHIRGGRKPEIPTHAIPSTPSGLKAGFADDNEQFNYFIHFLEEYKKQAKHYKIPIQERMIFSFTDEQGKSLPNADILVLDGKKELTQGKTWADGTFLFFPSEYKKNIKKYTIKLNYKGKKKTHAFKRNSARLQTIQIKTQKTVPEKLKVDILFILDTTGSMGEEINRLKKTIELIHMNLISLRSAPEVRFGLDLYKDRSDAYTTQLIPLTTDIDMFRDALSTISAKGGGDAPEDLQSALNDAIHEFDWNSEGIRLAFVITDAPPHLDYDQEYTYVHAAKDAKKRAIKIFTIGTGGLDISGEYVLRQIAQYTSAKYIFLTYGEKGESDGGKPGSVSHHTGDNFQTDKLEAIIIRMAKQEIASFLDQPFEEGEDYFTARNDDDVSKENTLRQLFSMALSQLVDYSTMCIHPGTDVALLPIAVNAKEDRSSAEYFGQHLLLSVRELNTLTLIERNDLQSILDEHKLSLTGLIAPDNAAKIGNLLGAELMLFGDLFKKPEYFELFLKLVHVETGEVLSVTKLQIDAALGI